MTNSLLDQMQLYVNYIFSLALLSDDDSEMRQFAVEKILQIRQKADTGVRVWRKPTLKFEPFPKHYR